MENNTLLTTPRLTLRLPTDKDSKELQDFEKRNITHLAPWRSTATELNLDYKTQINQWKQEFAEGRSIRFLLFLKDSSEEKIIGLCNFTQIFRGPFQACYLGYKIDANHEGKGLMSEALERAICYMFEEQKIHRLMASYMPSNKRSGKLLHKLGFIIEGLAKDYLLVNDQWEDHVLTSLTNHNWHS